MKKHTVCGKVNIGRIQMTRTFVFDSKPSDVRIRITRISVLRRTNFLSNQFEQVRVDVS